GILELSRQWPSRTEPKSVGKCYFVIFFNLQLGTAAMYYNYSAIEEEIEKNKDHPMFAPLYFPSELHRRDALAKDLEYLYGEDWESKISCSAATQPYVDHIHKVGRDDPVLSVEHAWTYYMGDLSRGQILKKVAQRALKLPSTGEGVNFYHFRGHPQPHGLQEGCWMYAGMNIKEEVQDIGFHAHGDMGGDISKYPYHASKMGEEVVRDTIFLNILFYIMHVENALVVFTLLLPSFSVYHLHM
uniref:Heme oxygenase 2a n=1 Tax=Cyprinus carpio TaxID=7962 RepID=A0A8C1PKK7_CYPCA